VGKRKINYAIVGLLQRRSFGIDWISFFFPNNNVELGRSIIEPLNRYHERDWKLNRGSLFIIIVYNEDIIDDTM
jgi:hypothetical protein